MLYENDREEQTSYAIPDFAMKPAREVDDTSAESTVSFSEDHASLGESGGEEKLEEAFRGEAERGGLDPYSSLLGAVKKTLGAELPEDHPEAEQAMAQAEEQAMAQAGMLRAEQAAPQSDSVAAPDTQEPMTLSMVAAEKPIRLIQPTQNVMSSTMNVMDIKEAPRARIYVEEDVLVPDVKPDLKEILSMDGKIKLAEREIRVGQNGAETIKAAGDLVVQTLYIPEDVNGADCLVSIESRVPFKSDYNVGAGPGSQIMMQPILESMEFTRINERKFKVKATILLCAKEYQNLKINIFEGIKDVDAQMLKEKIHVTDVALKKTEDMEVREELVIKDNQPGISKILKYDVNLVENNKQILSEKAVVNGTVYCNVLYLGCISEEHPSPEPTLYQGKTDFTHFIKLNAEDTRNFDPAGGKAAFNLKNFSLTVKEAEDGEPNTFCMEADVDTTIEIYRNVEREVVTDIYHSRKEMQYDTEELCLRTMAGNGVSEVAVREIVTIPEADLSIERVAYISAQLKETSTSMEDGRSVMEGLMIAKLICIPDEAAKVPFAAEYEIPFRAAVEIPGIGASMNAENTLVLKTLWFDKIGEKQVEINASISVNTAVSGEEKHRIVKSVSILEDDESRTGMPALVLYVTKAGDNIWKIAKKFRTTIDAIKAHNELDYSAKLPQGTKLLIETKPN